MVNEWTRVRLGDLIQVRHGYAFPGSKFSSDASFPTLVTPGNFRIGGGFAVAKAKTFSGDFPEEFEFAPGALVVTMTDLSKPGDTLGYSAKIPNTGRYLHNQRIGLIHNQEPGRVEADFLYYCLQTRGYRQHVLATATGSTVRHTSPTRIYSYELELPPLDEQRRIAEVLGALDDLIDANEKQLVQLDELGMSLFMQYWDGRTWSQIGSLGTVTMGQSPPGDTYTDEPLGLPFHQGVRDFGDRFPTSRKYCIAPTRVAATGDILIAVRAPVGEINVAGEELAFGRGLASLRAGRPASALRALRALEVTWAAYQGTGTVFSSINAAELRGAKIPTVDSPELERKLTFLDAAYLGLNEENFTLRRTRDELLPLLMSGAVRVRAA